MTNNDILIEMLKAMVPVAIVGFSFLLVIVLGAFVGYIIWIIKNGTKGSSSDTGPR